MLKMVDGTGIIGVDMVCPLGGTVSPPQPPNFDKVEMEGVGSLMLPNSLKAPLERVELIGNSVQGENPAPDNPQEIKSAGRFDEASGKYLLDVKVTGKNLFNKELIKKAMQGVSYLYVPIYVKKGSKVSFSYSKTLPSGLNFYVLLARDMGASYGYYSWLYHSTATSLCNNEGTFVADNDVISLSFFGSDLDIMIENLFNYLQIEISDKPTPYEPYTEQTVQIALDEPLRGIGDYKDVLTKDGVVRKIKRIVFDGSEDEKWGIGIERENVIDFVSTQFSDATKINEHQRSMMDKLKWSSGVWGRDEIGQDMFAGILRINMPKTLTPDLQTFKTWLSQNPLTVDYVLAEPVTEPLPESVQAQLQALHSENGVTHVFVDSGEVEAGIKLTYRKEI